jgi:HEXXH motif-containing protein
MSSLFDIAAALSYPHDSRRATIIEDIVFASASQSLQTLKHRAGALLNECGGLADVLSLAIEEGEAWAPPFGAIDAALAAGSREALLIALAQGALWAHDAGIPGDWSVTLREPTAFRLGQRAAVWVQSLAVTSDGARYNVRATGPEGAMRWHVSAADDGNKATLLRLRLDDRPVRLSRREDVHAIASAEFLTGDNWRISSNMARATREIEQCWALLGRAPRFQPWIADLLRQIVFTDPGANQMESGSCRSLPGFVHVAHNGPIQLAEMLVHELSHQHYYLATRLGPVDDGSDTGLYWSPVKRAERPIAAILIAYHAFANILLMLREAGAARPAESEAWAANEAEIIDQLLTLERPLRATRALTELGRGLFEPLSAAIGLVTA